MNDRTPAKRLAFVERVLARQKGTCWFAGGDSRYCWNHPWNDGPSYLMGPRNEISSAVALMIQVMQDGIARILRKGQPCFRAPFAKDSQAAVGPVDVLEAQLSNVAGT